MQPPGPRPLRSLEFPDGLPKSAKLSEEERTQLREANVLFEFTRDALVIQRAQGRPFWLENPDHRGKLDVYKCAPIKTAVNVASVDKVKFDQCR